MGCGASVGGSVAGPNKDKLLLLTCEMPSHQLLVEAALPTCNVVVVPYDPDGDGKRSSGDMIIMGLDMIQAISSYSNVGVIEAGGTARVAMPKDGKKSFSFLLGHAVPHDMLETDLTQAPNYVRLVNMLADQYLQGIPLAQSMTVGVEKAALKKRGQIDFFTLANVKMDAHKALRPDVAKWTTGRDAEKLYFDPVGFQKWVDAVTSEGHTLKELGWE